MSKKKEEVSVVTEVIQENPELFADEPAVQLKETPELRGEKQVVLRPLWKKPINFHMLWTDDEGAYYTSSTANLTIGKFDEVVLSKSSLSQWQTPTSFKERIQRVLNNQTLKDKTPEETVEIVEKHIWLSGHVTGHILNLPEHKFNVIVSEALRKLNKQ